MADYKITLSPNNLIIAGLGSCIALCIYDSHLKIGGMAHVMLPAASGNVKGELKKYADTLIPLMFEEILKIGAKQSRLVAKITGGASMFSFAGTPSILKIGDRNIEAVKQELQNLKVPLKSEDVGGTFGRTICFDTSDGKLIVKTINQGEKVI
jgi:chemotaxis protein CheD